MALNVDLAGVAPADALDLAVLIEEESRQRYIELADEEVLHQALLAARIPAS